MARLSVQQKLGRGIKEHRARLGMTQEKLSEVTGLDRTYISGVERGVRNPSLRNIEKIAKALKVKITDLLQ